MSPLWMRNSRPFGLAAAVFMWSRRMLADFDLCTECYSNGKFGSGMTPADFVLMEPAEVPIPGGCSWTDQETLLLLEALELYGENWNEIAEHVATKTKAQCMLHFVQMPIEDTFLEGDEDKGERKGDDVLMSKDSSASDGPEKVENKIMENEDRHDTSSVSITKENDDNKTETYQGTSSSGIVINALKTAFQTFGSLPEEGRPLSFAEAGNPVVALAAFLVALVDHDLALKSSCSSLKAMSEDSPGIQLAMRHCFTLEDPPKHQKDLHTSESEDAQKEEAQVPVIIGNDETQGTMDKNDKVEAPVNNVPSVSSEECTQDTNANKSTDLDVSVKEGLPVKESGDLSLLGSKSVQRSVKDPRELSLPNENAAGNNEKNAGDLDPHFGDNPTCIKESGEPHTGEVTQTTSKEKITKSSSLPKEGDSVLPGGQLANAIKDAGDVTTSVEGNKETLEAPGTVKMLSAEEKDHLNAVDSGSAVGIREMAGGDDPTSAPNNDEKNCKTFGAKDDSNMNKIRRAAVTALSAAAVNAKLLANQEEDQIRQLVSVIIDKQLQKLEVKLALFNEIENVIMRVREQLERARQRLMHERAQIIAARLGLPASSSRSLPPTLPAARFAMSHGFSGSRPLNLASKKSPSKRQ